MAGFGQIRLTHNKFPQIAAKLPVATSQIVRKAAYDIKALARGRLWRGHGVDTGLMKNSIDVEMVTPTMAEIGPHTEYAIYVEYGTRKMAAIPFMTPAAEQVRPAFIAAMRQLERYL